MGIWAPSVKEFLSISNKWTDTAEQILDIAQHDWVNVKSNMKTDTMNVIKQDRRIKSNTANQILNYHTRSY